MCMNRNAHFQIDCNRSFRIKLILHDGFWHFLTGLGNYAFWVVFFHIADSIGQLAPLAVHKGSFPLDGLLPVNVGGHLLSFPSYFCLIYLLLF